MQEVWVVFLLKTWIFYIILIKCKKFFYFFINMDILYFEKSFVLAYRRDKNLKYFRHQEIQQNVQRSCLHMFNF